MKSYKETKQQQIQKKIAVKLNYNFDKKLK